MRKSLRIFGLLLLLTGAARAQDAETRAIQARIDNHPQPDTFRVNRLNELAGAFGYLPKLREAIATQALTLARQLNYTQGTGYALVNLAYANTMMGKKPQAAALLKQADAIAKNTDDPDLAGYVLIRLARNSRGTDNQAALAMGLQAERIARQRGNKNLLFDAQNLLGILYSTSFSDFPNAINYYLAASTTAGQLNSASRLAGVWSGLGATYGIMGDQPKALGYYQKALAGNKTLQNKSLEGILLNGIGETYRLLGNYPKAIENITVALKTEKNPVNIAITESNLADVYTRLGQLPLALRYGFHARALSAELADDEGLAWVDGVLSRAYLKKAMPDSALYFARQGYGAAQRAGTIEYLRDNSLALANAHAAKNDFASAYPAHLRYIAYRDSMVSNEITNKANLAQFNFDLDKKQAQITQLNQEKKSQQTILISALVVLALIGLSAFALLRSNRIKQRANALLQKQKTVIEDQRDQTNQALAELQRTQVQLVQAEKMASLGELTAGIAHEIQNPLNFVNNFAEVSAELVQELEEEAQRPTRDAGLESELLADVRQNLQKITHHGGRASSIVRAMLEHSRTITGQQEPTDLNALAEEYLKLAYQGLRAKDRHFNAELITAFDPQLGRVSVVPQEIGRVLLNLSTTLSTRWPSARDGGADYKPRVSVQHPSALSRAFSFG